MEKFGLIDLTDLQPRDYNQFFLKRNPFPAIGVPSDTPPFAVDREQMKKRFKDVIVDLQKNNSSSITVLVGDYGSGKSHLLKLFKHSVNTYLLPKENGILAVYIKSPGDDFRDFLLQFVEDIGRDFFEEYCKKFLKQYFEKNPNEIASFIHDSDKKNKFLKRDYEIEQVIKNSRRVDLFNHIKNDVFKDINSNDLIFAFLTLSHPDYSSKAWRWFLGEKVKEEKDTLKIESSIEDAEKAYEVFKNIIKLLKKIEIVGFVLLIDELESITLLNQTKRGRYQDQLRTMIDDYPQNLCLYFAIVPDQWREITSETTALVRRLAGSWFELAPFDKNLTKELIETYLYSARIEKFSSKESKIKFPESDPALCPFTTESIDEIYKVSKGQVSAILLICHEALDYLYDYKQFNAITPDLIQTLEKSRRATNVE